MAPKGQKRSAQETKRATAAKKSRTDAPEGEDTIAKAIADAVELSDLPQTCKNMLVVGIRGCLSTPSEERHEAQALIVSMVDEVISANDTRLQQDVEAAKAAESDAGKATAELGRKVSDAKSMLEEKITIVEEKTLAASSAAEKIAEAANLLSEKQACQSAGDASMLEMLEDKASVESAIETDMKAITEGKAESAGILAVLQKLSFDDSLIKALPATCTRGPADRGSFDGMVLKQLETSLAQKLADLIQAVALEAPRVHERAQAVDSAQTQVVSATSFHVNAVEEQSVAEASRTGAAAAVEAVTKELADHELVEKTTVERREATTIALESFQTNTRAPFIVLVRDRKAITACEEVIPDSKVDPIETDAAAAVSVGGA